jgi:hypothetical protein
MEKWRTEIMNAIKNKLGAAILFLGLAVGLPAAAASDSSRTDTDVKKKVYEKIMEDEYVSAYFGVDRSLGRAWIEVAAAPWVYDPSRDVIARESLKGLYYDADRQAIVYQNGANETICTEDWKFLLSTSLKSTGNCDLLVNSGTRNVDDGFNVAKDPVTTVTFVAHNASPSRTASVSAGEVDIIVVSPDQE